MTWNSKDLMAGLAMILFGLGYGLTAWLTLPMGRALSMGPGYLPFALASVLTMIGVYLVVKDILSASHEAIDATIPYRAIACIAIALLFFVFAFQALGIFLTIFLTTLIAAFARRGVRLWDAVLGCLIIAAICAVIFGYFLGLPVPMLVPDLSRLHI